MSSGNAERGRGRGRGRGGPGPGGDSGPGRGRGGGDFGPGRGRGGDFRGRGGPGGPPPGRGGFGGRGGGPLAPQDRLFASNQPARIDSRLATSDSLIASLQKLNLGVERPPRPGYGKLGTAITVRANFFPVKVPKGPLFDYKVDVTPKTDINRLKARVFLLLEDEPAFEPYRPFVAHDGSERLIAARKLPHPLNIKVRWYEDGEDGPQAGGKEYNVEMTLVRELNTTQLTKYMEGQRDRQDPYDPLPLISALNLVLQHHAARTGVRVGKKADLGKRYFFPETADKAQLSLGVEAWKGFFTSVRPVYKQLMVNVNVCMTPFYVPGNLGQAVMAFQQQSKGGMPAKFAQGIKVTTRHLGYKKKNSLTKIMTTTARSQKFPCEEFGGQISVEDFFRRKYDIILEHPHDWPLAGILSRNQKTKEAKWAYLPIELCEIEPGQPYRGRLSETETANMIRYACNPPAVNARSIVNQGLPSLAYTADTLTEPMEGFGTLVSPDMAVVPARELPHPKVNYRVGKPNVRDGSWNILDVKFQRGAAAQSWWVLVVRDFRPELKGPDDPRLRNLVSAFQAKCAKSGIALPGGLPKLLVTPQLVPPASDPSRVAAVKQIRDLVSKNIEASGKPSLVIVLLNGRDNYIYPGIKRMGEVELGFHTVHMQLSKALNEAKQDQYLSNIALKVNTKLGGLNHALDAADMQWLTKRSTMMVGMDVTHPSPQSMRGTPSIAAVVASVDSAFVQFPASIRIQESKKEMITELGPMMLERLQAFEKKSKTLPERIFIFRDGVSEGQFDTVLNEEFTQMLTACKKMGTAGRGGSYRPKFTIWVCGKRHHARFYPTDSPHADKNGNTRPGTVLDQGITTVFDFDYYLQAHAGLQGSVKATHYTIVLDENKLGADEAQQGTHTASYLYARATKSVSLIPPAYYADLACERGRLWLNELLNLGDDKSSSIGPPRSQQAGRGRDAQAEKEAEERAVFARAKALWGEGLHEDLRGSMFYI